MRVVLGVVVAILLIFPRMSPAQTAGATGVASRTFVDVNLAGSATSDAKPREFTSRFVTFGEAGSSRASYPKPSRATLLPLIDLGGGYMAGSSIGLGVHYSRAVFEDTAKLAATVPHPVFLNAPASNTGVTDRELRRVETAINIFVSSVPLRTSRAELRFFGGPSFFWLKADMVQSVLYAQSYGPTTPTNTISITGFTSQPTKGHGTGFHVGSDFSYFFTKMAGVSGGVRYSQANVKVKQEPLSKLSQEIRVGGTLMFLGVRLRFGR